MRYVYVLLNTLKSGNYNYGNLEFKFEPFYVGHGTGARWRSHYWNNCKSNNKKLEIIRSLKRAGHKPTCVFIKENLNVEDALILEMDTIKIIGRLPSGSLMNMSNGGEYYRGDNNVEIGKYELIEDNKAKLIHIYDKRVDAELIYGSLYHCLDKNGTKGGFIWRKIGDHFDEYITVGITFKQLAIYSKRASNLKKTLSGDKRVCRFDKNGDLIKIYPSRSYIEKLGINCNYLNLDKLTLNNDGFFLVYAYKLKSIDKNLFKQGFVYENGGQLLNEKNKIKILKVNINTDKIEETFESIRATNRERSIRGALKNKGYMIKDNYIWIKECDMDKINEFKQRIGQLHIEFLQRTGQSPVVNELFTSFSNHLHIK